MIRARRTHTFSTAHGEIRLPVRAGMITRADWYALCRALGTAEATYARHAARIRVAQ